MSLRATPLLRHLPARRLLHTTPRALFPALRASDALPASLPHLHEDSPGNSVDLVAELKRAPGGRGVVVGIPAAFSGTCTAEHVPGWMKHPKLKEAGLVVVVGVNDAFVMKAWADQLDPGRKSGIRFLADPAGEFTKALDLGFDATPILGNMRSKRYAMVVRDGKVESLHVEPDNTGASVSTAQSVLG